MATFVEALKNPNRLWAFAGGFALLLIVAAVSMPILDRANLAGERTTRMAAYDAGLRARDQVALSESLASSSPAPPPPPGDSAADRKIVRTISLEMTVANPVESAEKIQAFAAGLGGYIESSQVNTQGTPNANLTIRVPAAKLEEAKTGLRKMAIRVDSEKTDADDVTKQYVDEDARLHNLRAEEAQYLTIMKSATKVTDMLEVSEKLSNVRGEIEQQQAEFATLSKQVETVAITISLQAQAAADVFGFHWQPAYQLKLAAHDALAGLATYVTTMTRVLLFLPVLLIWMATGLLGAWLVWRVARWVRRMVFGLKSAPVVAS